MEGKVLSTIESRSSRGDWDQSVADPTSTPRSEDVSLARIHHSSPS